MRKLISIAAAPLLIAGPAVARQWPGPAVGR